MSTDTAHSTNCLSCRIVCGISLTCAGLFIGYHGYRFPGYNRAGMLAIATRKLTPFYYFAHFLTWKTTFCKGGNVLVGVSAV
jgi:hypothetical protein